MPGDNDNLQDQDNQLTQEEEANINKYTLSPSGDGAPTPENVDAGNSRGETDGKKSAGSSVVNNPEDHSDKNNPAGSSVVNNPEDNSNNNNPTGNSGDNDLTGNSGDNNPTGDTSNVVPTKDSSEEGYFANIWRNAMEKAAVVAAEEKRYDDLAERGEWGFNGLIYDETPFLQALNDRMQAELGVLSGTTTFVADIVQGRGGQMFKDYFSARALKQCNRHDCAGHNYCTQWATIKCNQSTHFVKLMIPMGSRNAMDDFYVASTEDNLPIFNVPLPIWNKCYSLLNPITLYLTTQNFVATKVWKTIPGPCIYVPFGHWKGACNEYGVAAGNFTVNILPPHLKTAWYSWFGIAGYTQAQALTDDCTLSCLWGGEFTINECGQGASPVPYDIVTGLIGPDIFSCLHNVFGVLSNNMGMKGVALLAAADSILTGFETAEEGSVFNFAEFGKQAAVSAISIAAGAGFGKLLGAGANRVIANALAKFMRKDPPHIIKSLHSKYANNTPSVHTFSDAHLKDLYSVNNNPVLNFESWLTDKATQNRNWVTKVFYDDPVEYKKNPPSTTNTIQDVTQRGPTGEGRASVAADNSEGGGNTEKSYVERKIDNYDNEAKNYREKAKAYDNSNSEESKNVTNRKIEKLKNHESDSDKVREIDADINEQERQSKKGKSDIEQKDKEIEQKRKEKEAQKKKVTDEIQALENRERELNTIIDENEPKLNEKIEEKKKLEENKEHSKNELAKNDEVCLEYQRQIDDRNEKRQAYLDEQNKEIDTKIESLEDFAKKYAETDEQKADVKSEKDRLISEKKSQTEDNAKLYDKHTQDIEANLNRRKQKLYDDKINKLFGDIDELNGKVNPAKAERDGDGTTEGVTKQKEKKQAELKEMEDGTSSIDQQIYDLENQKEQLKNEIEGKKGNKWQKKVIKEEDDGNGNKIKKVDSVEEDINEDGCNAKIESLKAKRRDQIETELKTEQENERKKQKENAERKAKNAEGSADILREYENDILILEKVFDSLGNKFSGASVVSDSFGQLCQAVCDGAGNIINDTIWPKLKEIKDKNKGQLMIPEPTPPPSQPVPDSELPPLPSGSAYV